MTPCFKNDDRKLHAQEQDGWRCQALPTVKQVRVSLQACAAGLHLFRLRPCLHGSLRSQTHPRSTMTLMVRSSLRQGVIACHVWVK